MTTIPERLRARKRTVGQALLPLIATVWTTSGYACVGMTASASAAHTAAVASHGDGHHAHGTDAQHAAPRAAADPSAADPHPHERCPHCGTSSGPASAHVACAALDDVAGAAKPAAPLNQWDGKSSLFAIAAPAVTFAHGPPSGDRSVVTRAVHRSVRLHLRHRVFLI